MRLATPLLAWIFNSIVKTGTRPIKRIKYAKVEIDELLKWENHIEHISDEGISIITRPRKSRRFTHRKLRGLKITIIAFSLM